MLFRVRTALFLSGGGVAVANAGNGELLLFRSDGELRARAGGEGGGPGEFAQLTSLSVGPADSLFAYDARHRRISVFDSSGAFVHALTLGALDTLGLMDFVGLWDTGELVGAFHQRTFGAGLVRDTLVVVTVSRSGVPDRVLGRYPHLFTHWGPHALPGEGRAAFPIPVPLSPVTAVGLGPRALYVGLPDPYTLIRVARSGSIRVTRQRAPAQPVTEGHREQMFAALSRSRMLAEELAVLRGVVGPSSLPAFGFEPLTAMVGEQALVTTEDGSVWLHPFLVPGDTAVPEWPRFDSDGLFTGKVRMSRSFRATAVRGDTVLGVYRDESDAEYVQAYRVVEVRR